MKINQEYLFRQYIEDGEKILFIAHRHPFVLIRDLGKIFLVHGGIPLFIYYLFPQLTAVAVLWALIGIVKLVFVSLDWYFDAWLLTNMGIIGIEWIGFFDRTASRVEYASIEGVSYTKKGVLQTFFNYGNVTLAKLGGPSEVTIKDALNPKRVEKNIVLFQEKFMTSKNFQDQEVLKQLLSDIVVDHIRKKGIPKNIQKEVTESVNQE